MNWNTPAIIGMFCIAFCLWMLRFALKNLTQADASSRWPNVEGRMISVTLWGKRNVNGEHKDVEHLSVKYGYEVDGMRYEGSQVGFYTLVYPETVAFAERHPSNSKVTVFYHPTNPQCAVLTPGAKGNNKRYSEVILASLALLVAIMITTMGLLGYLN